MDRANQYTRVAAGQTDSQIASGGTITIYSVNVHNGSGSAAAAILEDAGGNEITRVGAAAGESASLDCTWLADEGLQITTPTDVTCTVFHSSPGA